MIRLLQIPILLCVGTLIAFTAAVGVLSLVVGRR